MVCQCNQITRGALSAAISAGHNTIEKIGSATDAGTVCGSCQPLISNLLGQKEKPVAVIGGTALAIVSVIAAIVALALIMMPGIASVDSVQKPSYEFLWTDGFWKQVSGFSLLGVVALGLLMSLRKRANWSFLGQFSYWRIVHVVLGAVALSILFIHTGAHLGENLNRWLMVNFLIISVVGAIAGLSLQIAAKTSASAVQAVKKSSFWAHIIIAWPLPALLIAHVLSVYYF